MTEDEIDNYVDTLTNTNTSSITENGPTKSIKLNSIGLPIEITELIRQKRTLWQRIRIEEYKTNTNRLQKRISKDIATRKGESWRMYCSNMELSKGHNGIKTRSVTTTEKLQTFTSQLEGVFTN